jgi:hypothetical protein
MAPIHLRLMPCGRLEPANGNGLAHLPFRSHPIRQDRVATVEALLAQFPE